MSKLFVRAIGLFGRVSRISDKYEEPSYPITDREVRESYQNVEALLRKGGKSIITQQVILLPHAGDGIISGPHAGSGYLFNGNGCFVANCLESGNGFNFDGVYQCLISAAFNEEDIRGTFERLKIAGGHYDHWEENPRFTKEIDVPSEVGQDIPLALRKEPKLLAAVR
jgi:hypothetical protein